MTEQARNTLKTALFCYSAANLYLLPFWVLAFGRNGMPLDRKWVEHYYELSQIFDYVDYGAAVLLSLLLAAVIFGVRMVLARLSETTCQIFELALSAAGIAVLAAAIWVVSDPPSGNIRVTDTWIFALLGLVGLVMLALIAAAVFARTLVLRALRAVVLWCTPIGVIMAANAYAAYYKTAPEGAGLFAVDRTLAPLQKHETGKPRKVVLMILDMWDHRVTFEVRSPDLDLPEIDRFRASAFFATNAERAGNGTRFSVPGMLIGRKIMYADYFRPDMLKVVPAEEQSLFPWTKFPGTFADARENGFNTAVVATAYHPYCRLFPAYISSCWIDDTPFQWTKKNVVGQMGQVVAGVARQLPYLNRLFFEPKKRYSDEWGIHLHFAFREKIKELAVDPRYQFVFVHWLLPHPPYIYDYKEGEYRYDADFPDDYYWGNLKALDLALGEIRQEMEAAGVWDDAFVILTSDHGFNLGSWPEVVPLDGMDPRSVFMAKFPHQTTGLEYSEKFLMVSLREVLQGILGGTLTMPEQMPQYLSYPVYYH
ncbi:MAG: sulfatase-like hydrolase/transferase [Alphaproteobacteria bacterium]|nr:sulfatase-like hydrolase/transferase [Alphaproteobacteria bacterium]